MLSWKQKVSLLAGVLFLGVLLWWALFLRGFGTTTLATGQEGGTYRVLGNGFTEYVEERAARFEIETLVSQGTAENLDLLENGDADFAIVQSGQVRSDEIQVVAKLYTEVLHVVVREEAVVELGLASLRGVRISLGAAGSGSRPLGQKLLAHFGVQDYEEVPLSPAESLDALKAGKLEAIFIVTALQSQSVREAMREGGLKFLNLGEAAEGLVARFPFLTTAEIPAMAYHSPAYREGAMPHSSVQTVGVPSLLVCRRDLSPELVYEVVEQLFASRSELSELAPEAYQITEITSGDLLSWSVHPGAQRFYQRREPGFLERYAEVMAFLMSLGAAAWAVWGTVSKWSSRKKKNRIDDYYLEVAAAFLRLDEELSLTSLEEERGRLRNLRSRAFQDLASEKLKADDSFEIFQNQLALCLDDIRRREERVARDSNSQ